MKNLLLIFLFLFCLIPFASAQIFFDGRSSPMSEINTSFGQNYLTLNPFEKSFAYTEERGGVGDETIIEELELDSFKIFLFKDWLNSKGMISPIGFFEDNLYYNQVTFDQGRYIGKVYRVWLKNDKREEVNIPFFKNKAPLQSGCISKDGNYMILSMESSNTYGVEDLYVVKRKHDGSWERAKNLGYILNTNYQEITPFLAEDNRTLFFATNGRGGQGSFDIFYTIRQDDSWRNWSVPVNLGEQINTPGSETSFSYQDGDEWAYYINSQNSEGYGDIMRIRFKEEIEEDTAELEQVVVLPLPSKESDEIVLKIVDSKSREITQAELLKRGRVIKSETGIFLIDSLSGEEVEIKSKGYLPKILILDERLKAGENIIELASVTKGSIIILDHVLFYRGTSNMVEGSEKELNLVVEMMNDNPKIKILLKGHTDNTGNPDRNIQLSEERVKMVREYIINQNINPSRIREKGFGGNQPIASNETEETRKLNRRVEFEVIED